MSIDFRDKAVFEKAFLDYRQYSLISHGVKSKGVNYGEPEWRDGETLSENKK